MGVLAPKVCTYCVWGDMLSFRERGDNSPEVCCENHVLCTEYTMIFNGGGFMSVNLVDPYSLSFFILCRAPSLNYYTLRSFFSFFPFFIVVLFYSLQLYPGPLYRVQSVHPCNSQNGRRPDNPGHEPPSGEDIQLRRSRVPRNQVHCCELHLFALGDTFAGRTYLDQGVYCEELSS